MKNSTEIRRPLPTPSAPLDGTDIGYLLKKRGYKHRDIATELGVSRPLVTMVISGERTSRHIANHIASILDLPLAEIWPDRYPDEAGPTRRRSHQQ